MRLACCGKVQLLAFKRCMVSRGLNALMPFVGNGAGEVVFMITSIFQEVQDQAAHAWDGRESI